ncbi:hypothetical protein QUF74_16505 [Candidatus Halobeggiatoa sp. HSG11]|nr:hypothetical protein [Candidatus Halobeggiatoa sp. HSG11]
MAVKNIQKQLEKALLNADEMHYSLYEYELEELLEHFKSSLKKDKDEFVFAVTENNNHVAMVLIECSGQIYINESARDKLKEFWKKAYSKNIQKLIPMFAKQLNNNQIPINGVKTAKKTME